MMFFEGHIFWFLMGMLFVLVAAGFNAFAQDRGWKMTWWKWVLTSVWYLIFSLSFYAWGTLIGEGFPGAGLWLGLLGLFISAVLGVGLWRLLALNASAEPEAE